MEGLGGRVRVVRPGAVFLSWGGAPVLALGATRGLGGGLGLAGEGVSLREGVSLGGGGLGAGTGAEAEEEELDGGVSVTGRGLGVTAGFSVFLEGWGAKAGADFGVQEGAGSAVV